MDTKKEVKMKNWADFLVRGNLVDFDGVVATVVELRVNNCRIRYKRRDTGEEHTSLVEYYRLKPLLLSEDILINQLGFVKVKDIESHLVTAGCEVFCPLGRSNFEVLRNNMGTFIVEGYKEIYKKLDGVHHLQNFYCANFYEDILTKQNYE
jgi:hypothetical protein